MVWRIATEYMRRLGTPFPAGQKIKVDGCVYETILGWEFDLARGLYARTEAGNSLPDYEFFADRERRSAIRDFYKWLLGEAGSSQKVEGQHVGA